MAHSPYSSGSSSAREVSDILTGDGQGKGGKLSTLLASAKQLQRLDNQVRQHLPDDLAPQVRVATLKQGELVLLTPNATWATRLRMQAAGLAQRLSDDGLAKIRRITVQIAPLPAVESTQQRPRKLSRAALDALRRIANMSDDEEIRSTVDRLERRASRE